MTSRISRRHNFSTKWGSSSLRCYSTSIFSRKALKPLEGKSQSDFVTSSFIKSKPLRLRFIVYLKYVVYDDFSDEMKELRDSNTPASRKIEKEILRNVYKDMGNCLCFVLERRKCTFQTCTELKRVMGIFKTFGPTITLIGRLESNQLLLATLGYCFNALYSANIDSCSRIIENKWL